MDLAEVDSSGSKLACSTDNTIRIFELNWGTGNQTFVAELKGHEGPVWELAWAHPRYGALLASCSYDRRVIISKEIDGQWEIAYMYDGHESSVNSVCWAPPEWGLMLACGSSDGSITVLSLHNDRWIVKKIPNAHTLGCNAVSWAPVTFSDEKPGEGQPVKRLVSGGCDKLVKIWKEENEHWIEEVKLEGNSDWVRDVAWAPTAGLARMKIASSSQDGRVIIWNKQEGDENWTPEHLHGFDDVVSHVSWNLIGDTLEVTGVNGQICLWKEQESGRWECITNDTKARIDNLIPVTTYRPSFRGF